MQAQSEKENIVADALSRSYAMLSILAVKILGFHYIKELDKENKTSKR